MTHKSLPHDHGHLSAHLQAAMPKAETFESVAALMKLLGDGKRMQIFWLLCHCEECVINISALLEMSPPAASHHLKTLKNAGLVHSRREGKEVYYTAAGTSRVQILHQMIEQIVEVTCPAPKGFEENPTYDSTIQTVNEAHQLITEEMSRRYTIEELSLRFHINQTTLKTVFKTLFGQSIAAYMKEYRIKRAMEYLNHSALSIAEIAALVGYENQSKFTQAFKSVTGLLPKDYRKKNV